MSRPRLVATDLDGTLLRRDGTVSPRTRRALHAVEDAGAALLVVTGRPPRWLTPVVDDARLTGRAVAANGALTIDVSTGAVLARHEIDVDAALALVAALRSAVPGVTFAAEFGTDEPPFGHEPGYTHFLREPPPPGLLVADSAVLLRRPAVKLLARTDSHDGDGLLAVAHEVAGQLPLTLTHSSRDGLLEVSAAGVDKASALASYAAELGVDASVSVAFGDMPNDLPMLAWAGLGVAVGNAHPQVLAAADVVAPTNDEDGVAAILARWF